MYPSLVLSAALIAPAAPVPRDATPNTPGPAPRVLALKADASGNVRFIGTIPTKVTVTNTYFVVETEVVDGKQVQKQVQKQADQDVVSSQYVNKTLAEFGGKFTTAGGTPLTATEAAGRLKNGATLLASSDGKPVAPAWLRAVDPGTVVMVADGLAHLQPQWSPKAASGSTMPETPDPRLVMLGTDDSGKVVAPCTSNPVGAEGGVYYGNDVIFEKRLGGARMIRGGMNFDGAYYGGPQPVDAKVVYKSLADVKFEAFDVAGQRVSRTDAMKRLAAGGLVLVAGDGRLPDEDYLRAFHKEVLVLVGPELVLPIPPVDQTRKKGQPQDGKGQDAAPAVRPLPAIKPGVIINRARNVALPAAPAVEKK